MNATDNLNYAIGCARKSKQALRDNDLHTAAYQASLSSAFAAEAAKLIQLDIGVPDPDPVPEPEPEPDPPPPPELKIDSVTVDSSILEVAFSGGVAPYEVQLDGWGSWRQVTSPYEFPQPIDPGSRTVYVRDSGGDVVQESFVVPEPEPTPEPTPEPSPTENPLVDRGMSLVKSLHNKSDWPAWFIAGSEGSITVDDSNRIFVQAPPKDSQVRCENQFHNSSLMAIPGTIGYRYGVEFPSGATLGNDNPEYKELSRSGLPDKIDYHRTVNFNQHHSDQSCYTGGLAVDNSGRLYVSISGGKTTSFSGSCDQYYEVNHRTNYVFERDKRVEIVQIVKWHESDGSWEVWADGVKVFEIFNVPTSGEHNDPKDPATNQKFRIGCYGRPTTPNGFKAYYDSAEVWK